MIRLHKVNIHGNEITIDGEQFEYLTKVMRSKIGDEILLFNELDGEFLCKISAIERRFLTVKIIEKKREFVENPVKIFCVFAKIKQKNVELIVQKCTEIGVHGFIPMVSARTVEKNLHMERLQKIAIEASEQCGRIDVPKFLPEIHINQLMARQSTKHNIVKKVILLSQFSGEKVELGECNELYIVVGCEGGFTSDELALLEPASKLKLSNNVLRAETAAILGCGIVVSELALT